MKRSFSFRQILSPVLALAMTLCLAVPASAFFWNKKDSSPIVSDVSKNGLIGSVISFAPEDFVPEQTSVKTLRQVTIDSLPDTGAGILCVGEQPVTVGTSIEVAALSGLCFQSASNPTTTVTSFCFTPTFSTRAPSKQVTMSIFLLEQANQPPVARNMELTTYKNVAITGYFDAVDTEGDPLKFQITSTPARGSVTLAEDGSSQFVYAPYENKTGRDHFTYVALDPNGNISSEATVSLRIDKPDTKVTYADMGGHPAQKAAIRMAEEGIYVGQNVDGHYFFDPDRPVSRAQFLTMAMSVSGLDELEDVTLTGFSDDAAIPTWAKGSVSAALKAGAIRGSQSEDGAPVFAPDQNISMGEATVMLNNLLGVTDVPLEVFSPDSEPHWASQAVANLSASGVLYTQQTGVSQLAEPLTLSDAVQMLDGAIDVRNTREGGGWLLW